MGRKAWRKTNELGGLPISQRAWRAAMGCAAGRQPAWYQASLRSAEDVQQLLGGLQAANVWLAWLMASASWCIPAKRKK